MEDKIIKETKYFTIYLRPDGSTYLIYNKPNNNFEKYTLLSDNTLIAPRINIELLLKKQDKQLEEERQNLLKSGNYISLDKKLVPRQKAVITADNRSKWQREHDDKKTKTWLAAEHKKDIDLKVMNYMVLPAAIGIALITPAAPYVNAALFTHSANNLHDLYQNGTLGWNLETGVNTLGLVPGIGMAGKVAKPFVVSGINSARPYINKVLTGDKYTTLGGRYGYYGNPLMRFLYTLDRSSAKPKLKPIHPELLRKIDYYKVNSDGTILISNPISRSDLNRTNFTTDRPVVSHKNGDWDIQPLLIVDPKVVREKTPISIEPSDMFYTDVNIVAKPNLVTFVSGNPTALKKAWEHGMSTLSSKKLRSLYKQMDDYYNLELERFEFLSPLKQKLFKKDRKYIISHKDLKLDYALEIQRLQSLRGTPTLEDYKFLEKLYNLNSGVVSIETLNPKILTEKLDKLTLDDVLDVTYPNGRTVNINYFIQSPTSERRILNTFPYNRVFYDPTSTVESNFREALKRKPGLNN